MSYSKYNTKKCDIINLSENITDFGFKIYRLISESDKKSSNISISPINISASLLMLNIATDGNTEKQITKCIACERINKRNISEYMKHILTYLNSDSGNPDDLVLKLENCIFPNILYKPTNKFVSDIKEYYGSTIHNMDYDNEPYESEKFINNWIESKTNGKIKNMIQEGSTDKETRIILVNTILFTGKWLHKFETRNTYDFVFHITDNKKKLVKMMKKFFVISVKCSVGNILDCDIVELPYDGKDIVMLILIPNTRNGLCELEKKITHKDLYYILKKNMYSLFGVTLCLPRFKIESSYDMKEILHNTGISDIFDKDKANFSEFPKGTYISSITHKTFIEVDENGTEASGATAIMGFGLARGIDEPIKREFIADHPFMYILWDRTNDIPIFIGRVVEP